MDAKYFNRILWIVILSGFIAFSGVYAQSLTENYILTRTYTNDTGTSYLDQITYYDEVVREFK